MADSDALRARRAWAHRAGNHELCDGRRCAAVRVHFALPDDDREPVSTEAALVAWTKALHIVPEDARRPIVEAGIALARAIDDGEHRDLAKLTAELPHCVTDISSFAEAATRLGRDSGAAAGASGAGDARDGHVMLTDEDRADLLQAARRMADVELEIGPGVIAERRDQLR